MSPTVADSLAIAGLQLPSRVVFGPIATNLADGRAFSDRHTAFYRERAAGGCGLIVAEDASVHASDWPYERCPLAEEAGPGWTAIAEACGSLGAVTVAGLSHSGGQSTSAFSQREIWAPSDEPDVNTREVPKIMEQTDIDAVAAGFARAAGRAVASGMAGVEINAGQFSLVRQFLSGLTNRRGDAYGQDRSLFARQVLEAVRESVGPNGIVGLRLSGDELAPWAGITPESAIDLAVELAAYVDYLVVVRGAIFSVAETRPTAHHEPGFNLDLSGAIRGALHERTENPIPVIAQGSIVSVDQANQALAESRCDAVEMTRAQLADPQLVTKARAGAAPRPCVLCNQLCNVRDNRNPIISCIANPRCGHETNDPPEPTAAANTGSPVTVTVVGGGPAGLEAARTAARCGASVQLFEQSATTGGMAATAAAAPAHRRLKDLMDWLADDAIANGVEIHCGHTVTAEQITQVDGPVILATGSVTAPLEYPNDSSIPIIAMVDVLQAAGDGEAGQPDSSPLDLLLDGEEIVVWDPIGGPAGVAVAELVAAIRPKVSFVTPDGIAGTMLSLTGDLAGANVRLQQAGVTLVRRQRLVAVADRSVELVHAFTGETQKLSADLVIDASSRLPDDQLFQNMPQPTIQGPAIRAGDAVAPRTVGEAIREGRAAALAVVSRNGDSV